VLLLAFQFLLCIIGPSDSCLPLWQWLEIFDREPSIHNPHAMPPLHEMPIWALNYWPYTWEEDHWEMMVAWGGQCDWDCRYFSNGIENRLEWTNRSAACITGWTGRAPGPTVVVSLPGFSDYVCNDSFGDPDFREPMYSEYWGMWVIPLDRFSPSWSSTLVWDWSLSTRPVSQNPP
jgi:hypothetical protein